MRSSFSALVMSFKWTYVPERSPVRLDTASLETDSMERRLERVEAGGKGRPEIERETRILVLRMYLE